MGTILDSLISGNMVGNYTEVPSDITDHPPAEIILTLDDTQVMSMVLTLIGPCLPDLNRIPLSTPITPTTPLMTRFRRWMCCWMPWLPTKAAMTPAATTKCYLYSGMTPGGHVCNVIRSRLERKSLLPIAYQLEITLNGRPYWKSCLGQNFST